VITRREEEAWSTKHGTEELKPLPLALEGRSGSNFLSLLLTFYLCYSQKDFSPWLLTSQPLLIFFEIYTQKVKILARERESCVWGGKKRNLYAKSGIFS
jgi:hypothetical protein